MEKSDTPQSTSDVTLLTPFLCPICWNRLISDEIVVVYGALKSVYPCSIAMPLLKSWHASSHNVLQWHKHVTCMWICHKCPRREYPSNTVLHEPLLQLIYLPKNFNGSWCLRKDNFKNSFIFHSLVLMIESQEAWIGVRWSKQLWKEHKQWVLFVMKYQLINRQSSSLQPSQAPRLSRTTQGHISIFWAKV